MPVFAAGRGHDLAVGDPAGAGFPLLGPGLDLRDDRARIAKVEADACAFSQLKLAEAAAAASWR